MKIPYEEAYLRTFTAIMTGMAGRLPFGVEVNPAVMDDMTEEAEEMTDSAIARLIHAGVVAESEDTEELLEDTHRGGSDSSE